MNKSETDKFRTILLELKSELEDLQESSHESTQPVELDQTRVGRLSRMDAMQGQQMAKETARRRELQLVSIEGALRRLDSGDFGYCSICDEAIDVRRLDVNPTSTRCVRCMEDI